jgi:hypothetical protein
VTSGITAVKAAVDAAFRDEWGRVVATLIRPSGTAGKAFLTARPAGRSITVTSAGTPPLQSRMSPALRAVILGGTAGPHISPLVGSCGFGMAWRRGSGPPTGGPHPKSQGAGSGNPGPARPRPRTDR